MSSKSSAIEANHHITEDLIKEEWQQVEAARKDVNAFRPLYDKYFDRIFRFIYRRTENEEVTADLTSQTFLKALKKLDKYSFKGVPFSAWLYRIADNEVKAFYRLSFKKRVLSLDGEEIKALAVEDSLPETQDFSKPLLKALKKLKDLEVEVIELRFFEDKSFSEMAFILDKSEGSIKMKLYRALEKLKKYYEEYKSHD